ncbi:hypothetical protein ACJRO7_015744 [Eucalyptus globulus]|uniref:K Homology domain-containing protein n=1 Tax=Eucalyptus globulus TaxID=34317 RepID=A0ABD3LA19_EUCGL
MADEAQYSSDAGINKRKYEEQTGLSPPPPRRPTGFSSGPIPSASPPDSGGAAPLSYKSVPPPPSADDVQAQVQNAKQRAQEIASRLLFNASAGVAAAAAAAAAGGGGGGGSGFDVKRARVENGSGFDSIERDGKPMMSTPSAIPVSYSYGQGTSKKIDIPNGRVGVIIGKAGETIKYLQLQSGAKIQVTRDMDADPNSPTRPVELMGTPEQIAKAEQLINDVLAEAEAGGSGIISKRVTGPTGSADQFVMKIPNNKVGLVIGKGGETIKNMQARTGARIQVVPLHLPPGDPAIDRNLYIDGTSEQIEAAKQLVNEVISENRMRNSSMSGGYPQQGYQARPPASWAPPGPPQMQQPGYGYAQPGMYPGAPPQYNMAQPQYGGYPPQPTSGGYPSSWDQSAVPPSQQTAQGGGYDYYGQQPPTQQQQTPSGPTGGADSSGYNYSQPPATSYPQQGQGYAQDGYGGYQAPQPGYGQPPPYDQQQGYNTAAGYGTNPAQEGHTPSYGAQGDTAQAPPPVQPSTAGQPGYGASQPPNPTLAGYPPQGTGQAGYGMPPTSQAGYGNQSAAYAAGYGQPQAQKPPANAPAYGGAQQSPSTPGGYSQAPSGQPGYPQSQPPSSGYSQPDAAAAQRGPPSGYGAPTYGAAPTPQPGYGQQPPPYNSYSGGYPQPPAYAADVGAGGGGAQGAQQSSSAKTSPQS